MDGLTVTLVVSSLVLAGAGRELWWRHRTRALRASLQAARSRAREGEDLAVMGTLVSGLAQDLKSPLQGLLGSTELMLAVQPDQSPMSLELHQLHDEASRAAGIVRNLLAFVESTTLIRRWHNPNDVVAQALLAARAVLDAAGVPITFAPAERMPLVYIDGRQIGKVIETLLCAIDVDDPLHPTRIDVATQGTEEAVVVTIVEVGGPRAGDDAEWSAGLAACHRVLKAHGGTMQIQQRDGDVHISVELPIGESAAAAAS